MSYKITYIHNGIKQTIITQNRTIEHGEIVRIEEISTNSSSFFGIPSFKRSLLHNSHKNEFLSLVYELDLMVSSKLPIKDAIDILLISNRGEFSKKILHDMAKALQDGQPIDSVLRVHQATLGELPALFFHLGEKSGELAKAITSLYEILFESKKLKESIRSALLYPLVILIAIVCTIFILFSFVVPKFEPIFLQFGDNLPLSTQILLTTRDILKSYGLIIFGATIGSLVVLLFLFPLYKKTYDKIIFDSLPFVSSLYKELAFYKLFLALSLIVQSKNTLQDALILTKTGTQNSYIEDQIEQIILQIEDGATLFDAFSKSDLLSPLVLRLLLVAETSNTLPTVLYDIAHLYKQQLTRKISLFISLATPFFMFLLAGIVLWLLLAIMTPVWEMGSIIR